ncbi:MAG: MerR family transcriptional regulator [Fidelibacterota bacterium]
MDQPDFQSVSFEASEPVFTIGVAAVKIGVSPETLRLYEREGLLLPHKTATGRRLYSHSDLDWIMCIRRQINIHKLNIAGIRRLLALIPCWNLKPCAPEERRNCQAYHSNDQACWQLNVASDKCQQDDCRDCNVYRAAGQVGHLKELFEMKLREQ